MNYKKILVCTFLVLLVYLTLFPRITELLNKNYVFGFDQGIYYLAVRDIVINHKPTLIGPELGTGSAGISGLFHGPGMLYLLAIPFFLANGDPYGGIVLMVLLGIAGVIVGFYVGKKMFGLYGGLVSSLLIAISPPLIAQSRFVWYPHGVIVIILFAFYFIYKSYDKKILNVFLAALFCGFTYNFEAAVAVPLSVAFFMYYLIFTKFKTIKLYIAMIAGFILAYSPMMLFEVRHGFQATNGLIQYLFHHKSGGKSISIITHIQDVFGSFLYQFADTFPGVGILPGLVLLLLILVGVSYFILKERDKKVRSFIVFLFVLVLIHFVIFLFLKTSVYVYYLLALTMGYILLVGYISQRAFQQRNIFVITVLFGMLGLYILLASISGYKKFIYDYSDYGGIAKIQGKTDAIDYIYTDAKGKPFGLLVFSPAVYTYPYDYILQWYAQPKYNFIPKQEKTGTFYLLIEPDPAKPWSYNGWLETVVKSGTVVETTTLPSGLIIQKRTETIRE